MPKISSILLFAGVYTLFALTANAQNDKTNYVPKQDYQIFEEMEARSDSIEALADSVTEAIRDRQETQEEKEENQEKKLLVDFTHIKKPASPEVFDANWHFAPVAQYMTGTCWSFSGTSLLESEVHRLTGKKIKLSEMFTVYYEYVEKARRFVAERGDSHFGQGSETNAVLRMFKMYGAVPLAAYPGLPDAAYERHDQGSLNRELRKYLSLVEENELWSEQHVLEMVRLILNKHLGPPPESFAFEGRTYTPRQFLTEVLQINPDDYVSVMSTSAEPFYTKAEFAVYDNWWGDESYHNVPLDIWYATVKKAIESGYSLTIGGDTSEPGINGYEDAAVIPDYDIPRKYINQHSREFRIYNRTTGDDHGIHLVAYKKINGRDWFLIKDSSSGARKGQFPGYFFYRGDYVRLKMLTFTVHQDMIADYADKFTTGPTTAEVTK